MLQALQSVKERGYIDSDEHLEDQPVSFTYSDSRINHDYKNRKLEIDGKEVYLTQTEHGLLFHLTVTPDQVVPYSDFRDLGYENAKDKQMRDIMKTHLRRLRVKIDPPDAEKSCIVVVRGVGYRYIPHGEWRKIPLQQPQSG